MKRIIFLLIIVLPVLAKSQGFPSTDSLHRYDNRFITNSAINAFTDYRLNTLLHGMINWIDSARLGTGGTVGVDTVYALNDSTIRYKKNGVFYNFTFKGVYDSRRKADTLYRVNDSTIGYTINGQQRSFLIRGVGTAGGGDASTNTSTSVDGEIALFSSTTGKLLKRATGTGVVHATSGVFGVGQVTNSELADFDVYPAPSTLGTIWYDSAFTSLVDFLPSGGPSIALSSAKIAVTNATAADAAQVAIKKYGVTNLHNWVFRSQARATNRVVGFGPGIMSFYSGDNSGIHVYVATTGSTGFFMRSAVSGTTLASGTGPSISTNDILEFTITRADSVITATVRNVTTSSATHSISKTYTAISGGTLIPNDCYFHYVSFGDNFEIISHEFRSTEVKNPTGMVLGDSKSDGYFSGTFAHRYWTALNAATFRTLDVLNVSHTPAI